MDEDLAAEQLRQNKKLEVFLGRWRTEGHILKDGRITGKIDAIDVYEWHDGHYAVIHHIESNMDELKIHGMEIISYDSSRKAYFAPFFDDQGSVGWEEIRFENNSWVWNGENVMGVKHHRCTAIFRDKNTMTAVHEHSEDRKTWNKWMEITLRKTD